VIGSYHERVGCFLNLLQSSVGKQSHSKSMVAHKMFSNLPVRSVLSKCLVLVAWLFCFDMTCVCPCACIHICLFRCYMS